MLSIGIIGGSDGPTSVIVSSSDPLYYISIAVAVAVLVVFVGVIIKRNKR